MIFRILLIVGILAAITQAAPGTTDWNVENAQMVADFYSGSSLWKPSVFLARPGVASIVTSVLSGLSQGAMVLAIAFFFCEAARILLSGGSLAIHESFLFYGKALGIVFFIGIGIASGSALSTALQAIFLAPIEAITDTIKGASSQVVMRQIAEALAAAAKANQDSMLSWYKKILELDISMLMTNFFMMFALVITWIISIYIGIMAALMLALTPVCLPFFLFQPVSNVGWNWVKSMIAFPMMGVVGSIVTGLLMTSGMLKFSVTAGAMGQNLNAIASSIVLIVVMVSVPGVTNSLFGGIMTSPMAAGRTLMGAAAGAAAAGVTVASASMAAGGPAASAAGRMGVAVAGQATPGEDFRATTVRDLGSAAQSMGDWAGTVGRSVLQSQFPTLRRIQSALAKDKKAGQSADPGTTSPGQESSTAPSTAAQAASPAPAVAAREMEVFQGSTEKASEASATQGSASAPAQPQDRKASKDWNAQIAGWSLETQHSNMANLVKSTYGSQDLANRFAEKLKEPQWSGLRIDAANAPQGSSYYQIVSPVVFKAMEEMAIKPAVVSSLDQLERKDRGKGWNFSMNSREANNSLMTDYVRSVAGDKEADGFAKALKQDRDYLTGHQAEPILAVAQAAEGVYKEAGKAPPQMPKNLQAVADYEKRAAAPVPQPTADDRGGYRGADTFEPNTTMPAERYYEADRPVQIDYLRQLARTANNGQYAQFADDLKFPAKWNPVPREGQSFDQAALGMIRALLERQGFIGANKKEKES